MCFFFLMVGLNLIGCRDSSRECSLQCDICKKTYSGAQTHFDLTPASGAKNFGEFMSPTTEFFR